MKRVVVALHRHLTRLLVHVFNVFRERVHEGLAVRVQLPLGPPAALDAVVASEDLPRRRPRNHQDAGVWVHVALVGH